MLGRPPKSNKEKALTGSKQTTSDLTPGEVQKSGGLSVEAAQEWDKMLAKLQASGIKLSPAHSITLTVCATLAADIRDCWSVLQANGGNYTKAGTGAVKLHPAAARLDVLRRDLTKSLNLLGLTRPIADAPEGPADELAFLDN
jgi:hypothetical protein